MFHVVGATSSQAAAASIVSLTERDLRRDGRKSLLAYVKGDFLLVYVKGVGPYLMYTGPLPFGAQNMLTFCILLCCVQVTHPSGSGALGPAALMLPLLSVCVSVSAGFLGGYLISLGLQYSIYRHFNGLFGGVAAGAIATTR